MMIAQHLAFIFVPRPGIEPAWRLKCGAKIKTDFE